MFKNASSNKAACHGILYQTILYHDSTGFLRYVCKSGLEERKAQVEPGKTTLTYLPSFPNDIPRKHKVTQEYWSKIQQIPSKAINQSIEGPLSENAQQSRASTYQQLQKSHCPRTLPPPTTHNSLLINQSLCVYFWGIQCPGFNTAEGICGQMVEQCIQQQEVDSIKKQRQRKH